MFYYVVDVVDAVANAFNTDAIVINVVAVATAETLAVAAVVDAVAVVVGDVVAVENEPSSSNRFSTVDYF